MRDVKDPEVRRAEIMEAALLLFMEKGYMHTTTQDIIDKVKISRGLLYYHFKNKEDILYCLVERYSEPLLQHLSVISYDKKKSAIEKVRSFIEVTLISPEMVTSEMVELQRTVDLEQNRYMMDKFFHNLVEKATNYFGNIIEQGISEKVFCVEYPRETACLLMTAYIFASNNTTDPDKAKSYLSAFKILVTRTLGIKAAIFDD